MSPVLISLMFGAGVAAFVWSYLARITGNAKVSSVLIGAGFVGVAAFIVLYTILKFVFNL
jgi:hypothetical protein